MHFMQEDRTKTSSILTAGSDHDFVNTNLFPEQDASISERAGPDRRLPAYHFRLIRNSRWIEAAPLTGFLRSEVSDTGIPPEEAVIVYLMKALSGDVRMQGYTLVG